MNSPEISHEPPQRTIYDLLAQVALEAADLDSRAHTKLHEEGDRAVYALIMKQRAQLVAELPTRLEEFRNEGGEIPEEVELFAQYYSDIAIDAIEKDRPFLIGTVLDLAGGNLITNPNDLERLAAKFQPPHEQ